MSAKSKNVLSMSAAAKILGKTDEFVLALALSGARQPTEQGGAVIEIDYDMDGNEVVFTTKGVERFLKRCPIGELVTVAEAAQRLGIHRSQISLLVYTGIPTAEGKVLKLPVWQIGGGDYVVRAELEAFAVPYQAAVERRAAREHAKKYQGRKPKQTTTA